MDDQVVVALEHTRLRVRWSEEEGAFELRSMLGDRRLATSGVLRTAEHVVVELTYWGSGWARMRGWIRCWSWMIR